MLFETVTSISLRFNARVQTPLKRIAGSILILSTLLAGLILLLYLDTGIPMET